MVTIAVTGKSNISTTKTIRQSTTRVTYIQRCLEKKIYSSKRKGYIRSCSRFVTQWNEGERKKKKNPSINLQEVEI